MKYLILILAIINVSLAYSQQDTLYLKNKFNENGNVELKDTTWMRAPLFYVDTLNGDPVTGVIIEKHRNGKRVTHAQNGYTLKQKSVLRKYTFYVFFNPKTQNYITVHYWNKKDKFKVFCLNDERYTFNAQFKSRKKGDILKTHSKEKELITFDKMFQIILETLPQYEADFRQIFKENLDVVN